MLWAALRNAGLVSSHMHHKSHWHMAQGDNGLIHNSREASVLASKAMAQVLSEHLKKCPNMSEPELVFMGPVVCCLFSNSLCNSSIGSVKSLEHEGFSPCCQENCKLIATGSGQWKDTTEQPTLFVTVSLQLACYAGSWAENPAESWFPVITHGPCCALGSALLKSDALIYNDQDINQELVFWQQLHFLLGLYPCF